MWISRAIRIREQRCVGYGISSCCGAREIAAADTTNSSKVDIFGSLLRVSLTTRAAVSVHLYLLPRNRQETPHVASEDLTTKAHDLDLKSKKQVHMHIYREKQIPTCCSNLLDPSPQSTHHETIPILSALRDYGVLALESPESSLSASKPIRLSTKRKSNNDQIVKARRQRPSIMLPNSSLEQSSFAHHQCVCTKRVPNRKGYPYRPRHLPRFLIESCLIQM